MILKRFKIDKITNLRNVWKLSQNLLDPLEILWGLSKILKRFSIVAHKISRGSSGFCDNFQTFL